ncbi:hypothetical protein VNO78_10600 [Psophocarpus tetragonolobus]|uniref:Uncharacterized protein n=1 Tax=Psophocarpus tetragonolobus TaxID=3891 RepID=A0AAN9SRN8_PSOTE
MAERLGNALMQDPSMYAMLESLANPSNKDQLEERMVRIKEDTSLKHILEEFEIGGLAKFGQAMGLANFGEVGAATKNSGGDKTEYLGNEDESIVHHTASVGDLEL